MSSLSILVTLLRSSFAANTTVLWSAFTKALLQADGSYNSGQVTTVDIWVMLAISSMTETAIFLNANHSRYSKIQTSSYWGTD